MNRKISCAVGCSFASKFMNSRQEDSLGALIISFGEFQISPPEYSDCQSIASMDLPDNLEGRQMK